MTLDDLIKILRTARSKANTKGEIYDAWEMDKAGVKAVVLALRDEILSPDINSCTACDETYDLFHEILGEQSPEVKVGTHGSHELDEDARKLEAMGQDPGMTIEELLTPAADYIQTDPRVIVEYGTAYSAKVEITPAADVCAWTRADKSELLGVQWWWVGCVVGLKRDGSSSSCSSCGKPISFVEAS